MNDFIRAITYTRPERIPVSVSFLPATWQRYGEALNRIRADYPAIFGEQQYSTKVEYYTPPSYHAGSFTDAWGCVWKNVREGYESIVIGHPLPERKMINEFHAPSIDTGFPHGFMFLRITDLRGFEEAMIDFAEQPPELDRLIAIVRDYNIEQAQKLVAASRQDVYYFGDDLGMQHALPIRPDTWRRYLKPAFKAIYDVIHAEGALVYMHTDGCIHEIIPDLIDAGVNCINPQIRANGIDNLVRTCKGKVCINLDLDRQLFPFASPQTVREHIIDCTKAMYLPEGGLMLTAECAADVPLENIEMICRTLSECADYKGE